MKGSINTTIKKENTKTNSTHINFNEELILSLTLKKIQEIEDNIKNNKTLPELIIQKNLKYISTKEKEKSSSNNYNVKILYEKGMILARKIIKSISQRKIPFNQISVDLLISCSGFISAMNKLKQFVILCGIVEALQIVNIKYSLTVIGKIQFKFTLKMYNSEHSIENMQKVLDCLFVKRFRNKHINDIYYSLCCIKQKMKFKTIFIFSDGLDEDFLLTKSWINKLNIYNNCSFGFFFINSEIICNKFPKELEYLKSKWDLFKKALNDSGIHIDLIYYKSTFEDFNEVYDKIALSVSNLLERTIIEKDIKTQEQNECIFNPPNFDLSNEDNLISISKFESALEDNFEYKSEIYIKTKEVLKNIPNEIYKININHYKNKLSKITEYQISNKKIKSDTHSYAKKFIDIVQKLNKPKIEAIFRPNMPFQKGQKILSPSGTDLHISSLIKYLINPSLNPNVYLVDNKDMTRNYNVSLIFDTSYSCLHSLCFSFSLQILRIILSSLYSIDIPCFDFILSRQNKPDILCSNISPKIAIEPNSTMWESLFSILSHPCRKSDLASAIEASSDLKRILYNEYTSYLFVLTDGLYEENEHKRILRAVNNCVKSGLNVFGIGIGIYPSKIECLFPKVIYCNNPYDLNKAIASFFGESISDVKKSMTFMENIEPNYNINLNNAINKIINDSENLNFQSLYNELNDIKIEIDDISFISKQENEIEEVDE